MRDREKTWTCRPPKDFGPLGHDYERAADDDTPFDEATLAKINELLAQRLQAKLTRAFDEADGCMDELQAIGVFVNDKLRGWRADGGAFPTHARIEGDGDAAWPYADEAVLALLAERSIAKRDADYETADAISTKLRDEMCVALDDKRGTWRAVTLSGGHFRVGPRVESGLADKAAALLEPSLNLSMSLNRLGTLPHRLPQSSSDASRCASPATMTRPTRYKTSCKSSASPSTRACARGVSEPPRHAAVGAAAGAAGAVAGAVGGVGVAESPEAGAKGKVNVSILQHLPHICYEVTVWVRYLFTWLGGGPDPAVPGDESGQCTRERSHTLCRLRR